MAFTTWAALRTAIKDAIADCISGKPFTKSYTLDNGMRVDARNYDELMALLEKTYSLEALESSSARGQSTYGRARRFR